MRYVLLLLFICNASPNAFAQHVGIKNDVLWDAAMMPNLGVELSMNRHVTVDLWGGGECWDYTNGTQLKLYLFQPELRYWPCQKFEGHFFGIHAHAAHFNVGLISFISELKHTVYRGNLYGGGLSYGYHFAFGKRWGLELTLGIGYAWLDYIGKLGRINDFVLSPAAFLIHGAALQTVGIMLDVLALCLVRHQYAVA